MRTDLSDVRLKPSDMRTILEERAPGHPSLRAACCARETSPPGPLSAGGEAEESGVCRRGGCSLALRRHRALLPTTRLRRRRRDRSVRVEPLCLHLDRLAPRRAGGVARHDRHRRRPRPRPWHGGRYLPGARRGSRRSFCL
jgi:hypothetical protein